MLKYYVPTMDGVSVVLAESGAEPLGGVWCGNSPELNALSTNQITMDAGVCRTATLEEMEARNTPNKYKRVLSEPDHIAKTSGVWQLLTEEERAAVDAAEAEAAAEAAEQAAEQAAAEEAAKQLAKSPALKRVENAFLSLCELLSGSKDKLGFADLSGRIEALLATDQNTAVVLSLRLLAIDAEGKREGGLQWWDDIAWHTDIV
jgi:hypothetical protein